MSNYEVRQHHVQTLLSWVRTGQIAIPEMQRPFVWNSTKVRDLLDSLYKGYPIGYLITWQSKDVGLRDGTQSHFRQILIDGQQRITAMAAALVGQEVVDKDYSKKRIKIAFNPQTEEFETLTPVRARDKEWIPDVAEFMSAASTFSAIRAYLEQNPEADEESIVGAFDRLSAIQNAQVGIITLSEDLDINTVTEIFIRINSKGVPLSSADFAMSKISSHGEYGSNLRKLIDYFCHMARHPAVYHDIAKNDHSFAESGYMSKIAWLKDDSSDLFDPDYTDIIRIAGLRGFGRGKMSSLVSLLSGRDFESRTFSDELAAESFETLERVLLEIVNQFNFQQFILTIKSAGFTQAKMLSSKNAVNFAYALYLRLRAEKSMPDGTVKSIVRRWFVMSMLTGRHSGSFESQFELDIRRISEIGAREYLDQIERGQLTDGFWEIELPSAMNSASTRSPYFTVFLASQVHGQAKGFLSKHITIGQMLEDGGDIHHLVPKNYLVKSGVTDRALYNQIANFALTETPVNIGITDAAPADYMRRIDEQIAAGQPSLGEITHLAELEATFAQNAIPHSLRTTTADTYLDFLAERRSLMAQQIRRYYEGL
ncbi:GmrSD restriction endonuclease domain-containing protein [Zafaria sp. Z1313]|uniref:GmrSD restriction endonuclease domain-containing protein n=1 Tax=Zafaria sp. Z1313 TaxID=3423202 RepID=UPI003D301ECB